MLSVTITSTNDKSLKREVVLSNKTVIGRDVSCNIHLPDPAKHISRVHAVIDQAGNDYYLTVASKTNPVSINGKSCQPGESTTLHDGDQIVIRFYELTVKISAQLAPSDMPTLVPSAQTQALLSAPSPWPDIFSTPTGKTESDPFGLSDLMAKPTEKPDTGPDPFKISAPKRNEGLVTGVSSSPLGTARDPLLNQSLDPMEAFNKHSSSNPFGISGSPVLQPRKSTIDDLLSGSKEATFSSSGPDQPRAPLVDLGGHRPAGTRSLEHVHDINLPYTPPPVRENGPPRTAPIATNPNYPPRPPVDDPFADTLKTYLNNRDIAQAAPQQAPFQPAAVTIPSARERRSHRDRRTPAVNSRTSKASEQEQIDMIVNAFRSAVGLGKQSIHPEEAVAYMESAGLIVRTAIEGITSLLASRSMMKGELGAEDRTMVASRDNNPLKLMPDINNVLQFLLDKKKLNSNAYLSPMQSIAGACEDLVYHELGTAAGLRAAVEGSIRRFNPQLIEAEFDKSGKKIVLNRKASLWETYIENYKKTETTMADDVGQIFERDFRRAYDEQIRKLKKK